MPKKEKLTVGGISLTRAEWEKRNNLPPYTIYQRIRKGWSVEKAVTTPPRHPADKRGPTYDMQGKTYGKLEVIRVATAAEIEGRKTPGAWWFCRCSCGNTRAVSRIALRRGLTTMCKPCAEGERVRKYKNSKRVITGTVPEELKTTYSAWQSMRSRVSEGSHEYQKIEVCERWSTSFWKFLEDMGQRPSPEHSLDRLDPDGNYEPGNVRWATHEEQVANRRDAGPDWHRGKISVDGTSRSVRAWARICGVPGSTVYARLKRGLTPREALGLPPSTPSTGPLKAAAPDPEELP